MTTPAIPFVVGCPRSGTSLLTVLLDRHSQIAMLPETHLLRTFVGDRAGWPPGPTHEHLLVAAWYRAWYRLRDLDLAPLAVLERFRHHACTAEGLLLTMLELWAERAGKPVAGEKTPHHIEVVDRILGGIPRAKITVIVRDGRAVVESHRRAAWSTGDQDDIVATWVRYARLAERWVTEFPEQVRLVRFEDLVTDPERVVAPLMAWYGQSFEPSQLATGRSPTFRRWEDLWKLDAEGPIDSAKRDAWRGAEELLSPEQLARLAPSLARFGYPEPARVASESIGPAPSEPRPARSGAHVNAVPLLIIGAQRAATRSVATWLATDPTIAATGSDKAQSPLASCWPLDRAGFMDTIASKAAQEGAEPRLVVDRAPYYLLHPDVARRARRLVPDARILVILRDPVTRAFSHWLNEWRIGAEPLPFGEALAAEAVRLGDAEERLATDEGAVSFAHLHYSYALGGRYHQRLAPWYAHFPSEQILVLVYEELVTNPEAAWKRLRVFLELPAIPAPDLPREESLRWPVNREKLLRTPEARTLRSQLASDVLRLEEMLEYHVAWSPK